MDKVYSKPKLTRIPKYTTMKVYTPTLKELRLAVALSEDKSMMAMLSRIVHKELVRQQKKSDRAFRELEAE